MAYKFFVRRLVANSLTALLLTVSATQVGATALERIRSTGVTTVCADPNNLPLSNSKLDPPGYDMEVASEIAKSLGAKLQYNWFAMERMGKVFRELYEGRCDFIVGIPTDKRLDGAGPRLALSQSYLISGFAIVIGKGRKENRLEDLKGQPIGVGLHTVSDFVVFDLGYDRVLFSKQAEVFNAVARDEIPAGLVWAPMAGWLAKQNPAAQVRILTETRPELTFSLAVGVNKDDPAFLDAVNAAISALIQSGKRDEILKAYGVPTLNSSVGAEIRRTVRASRNQAGAALDGSQPSLTRTVWRGDQATRATIRGAQSPFIRTVGGVGKASGWPPAEEQEAQGAQGVSEPPMKQNAVEQSAEKSESGFNLYHRACGKCHGRNVISGGIFPDLRNFEGSDADFIATVKKGRPGTVMPAWEKVMTEAEIERIRAYVKSAAAE
ncbi:transporter substrate-binding domain-containing protein [Aromatoleum diolicum]|uniref:Transporter substrate-binding domain-containing protein n=1 Tax=Aromatoleum diolicum TaxID=75796 RepID=A0ABX1QAJ0_9RHOO|nr:transporter substrate-binding domain-containing protein [Aromatoleum diolicum]NMG74219.1 transporter substrate-binding domain-containing protein [Aromatoleum diolicum]